MKKSILALALTTIALTSTAEAGPMFSGGFGPSSNGTYLVFGLPSLALGAAVSGVQIANIGDEPTYGLVAAGVVSGVLNGVLGIAYLANDRFEYTPLAITNIGVGLANLVGSAIVAGTNSSGVRVAPNVSVTNDEAATLQIGVAVAGW